MVWLQLVPKLHKTGFVMSPTVRFGVCCALACAVALSGSVAASSRATPSARARARQPESPVHPDPVQHVTSKLNRRVWVRQIEDRGRIKIDIFAYTEATERSVRALLAGHPGITVKTEKQSVRGKAKELVYYSFTRPGARVSTRIQAVRVPARSRNRGT